MEADGNKTIKKSLKSILYGSMDYSKLYEAIERANYATYICSYFIRSYFLSLYKSKSKLPKLNKEFILSAFNALKVESRGPKKKLINDPYGESLKKYYNENFSALISSKFANEDKNGCNKISLVNLSYIIDSEITQMVTSYENNIKLNFFKYICQFVNEHFKAINKELVRKCKGSDNKKEMRKKLNSELFELKNTLIKNKANNNPKYASFIEKYKKLILPTDVECYESDIKINPHSYIQYMLFMNDQLEKMGYKMFQSISLRTDIKDKYISINNNALLDIIELKNKKSFSTNLHSKQKDLWNMFFKIDNKKSPIKNYSFNYLISTDGYSVSINYIRNNLINQKEKSIREKRKGRNDTNKKLKGKTEEEILAHKNEKLQKDISKKEKDVQIKKELIIKNKEKIKKLTVEEKEQRFHKLRLKNNIIFNLFIKHYLTKHQNNNSKNIINNLLRIHTNGAFLNFFHYIQIFYIQMYNYLFFYNI